MDGRSRVYRVWAVRYRAGWIQAASVAALEAAEICSHHHRDSHSNKGGHRDNSRRNNGHRRNNIPVGNDGASRRTPSRRRKHITVPTVLPLGRAGLARSWWASRRRMQENYRRVPGTMCAIGHETRRSRRVEIAGRYALRLLSLTAFWLPSRLLQNAVFSQRAYRAGMCDPTQ